MVWIICLTAVYFAVADLIRFCKAPKECCMDPLKILEFIGTTLLIYNSLYSVIFNDEFTVEFWRIQAIICFFIYFRLVILLKYFENISYLIKMIIEVVNDMSAFLVVLFVAVLAFADAFFSLDQTK